MSEIEDNSESTKIDEASGGNPPPTEKLMLESGLLKITVDAMRIYIGNFRVLVGLSLLLSLPLALLFLIFKIPANSIDEDGVNLLFYNVLDGFRLSLIEAMIMLLLPQMLIRKYSGTSSFLTYFMSRYGGTVSAFSLVFLSVSLILINFSGLMSFIFSFLMMFLFPLIAMSEPGSSKADIIKESLSLVSKNIPFCLLMLLWPIFFILIPQIPLMMTMLNIDGASLSSEAENINKDALLTTLLGSPSLTGSNFFMLHSLLASIILPLKVVLFCRMFLTYLDKYDKPKLNAFLKRYGIAA